jgi:hypothetical protein
MNKFNELNHIDKRNTIDIVKQITMAHEKLISHEIPLLDQMTTLILRAAGPDNFELREIRNLFVKLMTLLARPTSVMRWPV